MQTSKNESENRMEIIFAKNRIRAWMKYWDKAVWERAESGEILFIEIKNAYNSFTEKPNDVHTVKMCWDKMIQAYPVLTQSKFCKLLLPYSI